MEIEVHSYSPGVCATATIDGELMTIPEVPGNRHWQMLQEWLADDNSWPPPIVIDLAYRKAKLRESIDVAAENERLKYITGGVGQAMTYTQKASEAAACLAESAPDAADYPMLAAEVGITADTLSGVAEVVQQAFLNWQFIGSLIEASRLGTKAAIDAAETVEAAEAAAAAVTWPAP